MARASHKRQLQPLSNGLTQMASTSNLGVAPGANLGACGHRIRRCPRVRRRRERLLGGIATPTFVSARSTHRLFPIPLGNRDTLGRCQSAKAWNCDSGPMPKGLNRYSRPRFTPRGWPIVGSMAYPPATRPLSPFPEATRSANHLASRWQWLGQVYHGGRCRWRFGQPSWGHRWPTQQNALPASRWLSQGQRADGRDCAPGFCLGGSMPTAISRGPRFCKRSNGWSLKSNRSKPKEYTPPTWGGQRYRFRWPADDTTR